MKTIFILLVCAGLVFGLVLNVKAQDIPQTDSPTAPASSPFKVSGYLETYYSFDGGNPGDHNRPPFFYSFARHNEVNLNLGMIRGTYDNGKVRGTLALMTGTYANANLAAEPGVLKNVYEAYAGVKVSRTKNVWVDAGIFSSHIGFESAIGADCWNLTRSIMAENSPYFESGVKVTYNSDNGKWLLSGLALNGWQRIQRVNGNNTPAFGHQLQYRPNSKVTLNSSSFVGSDAPDSVRTMRYFHNFWGTFQVTDKLAITAAFDIGAQQKTKGSGDYNTWYTPVLVLRYQPTPKVSVSARGEYYSDRSGVIIATGTPNGFGTLGFSANLDVRVADNVLWRIEGRGLRSKDPIFTLNDAASRQNFFGTTSLSLVL